jgi:hypothetical protein
MQKEPKPVLNSTYNLSFTKQDKVEFQISTTILLGAMGFIQNRDKTFTNKTKQTKKNMQNRGRKTSQKEESWETKTHM